MDTLKIVGTNVEAKTQLHEIVSDTPSDPKMPRVERYIVSTPHTRRVCTRSELIDFISDSSQVEEEQFRYVIPDGMNTAIKDTSLGGMLRSTWGPPILESGRRRYVDILQILRGGLNFDPSDVILQMRYRAKTQDMMLQRYKTEDDIWATFSSGTKKIFEKETPKHVRKLHIIVGDIVASGASIYDGLMKMLARIGEKHEEFRERYNSDAHYTLGSLIFFTIGSIKAEEMLYEVLSRYASVGLFAEDFVARVVYLEGRFGVAGDDTDISFQKNGTDLYPLIGRDAIPSPLFMMEWLSKPYIPLEACVIYDGGSRRCDPEFALEDVIHHFKTMREYAVSNNETLYGALKKRVPKLFEDSIDVWREAISGWRDAESVPDQVIEGIISQKNRLLDHPDTHAELLRVYDERISELERLR